MVQRKTVPVDDACHIVVVTERMADGWAVMASIKHLIERGERIVDLPVRSERFLTEAEAEEFGVAQARRWLEHNRPHAA